MISKSISLVLLSLFALFSQCLTLDTHIDFVVTNADGTPGPVVIYPGTYTRIRIKAVINSATIYHFRMIFGIDFSNEELNNYLVFDAEDGSGMLFPFVDEVQGLIGLKCSTPVDNTMMMKTYTLTTSGTYDSNTDYSGSFTVKIGGPKSIVELTPLVTQLGREGYSYLKSKKDILPIEKFMIECSSLPGSVYYGSFCHSVNIPTKKDNTYDRYHRFYKYYDTMNNLEIKYGSNNMFIYDVNPDTQIASYTYDLSSTHECIEISPQRFTFTVDGNDYIYNYGTQDKEKLVESIKLLENTVPSTLKVQFDVIRSPAKIDCISTLKIPITDYEIIDRKEIKNENYSYYTNYFTKNGTAEMDLLLPIQMYQNHYFVECLIGSAVDNANNVSFILGDWLFSNYPQRLEVFYPSYPKTPIIGRIVTSEEITNKDLQLGIPFLIMVKLTEEMNKDKPLLLSPDNGCGLTSANGIQGNNIDFSFYNSGANCKTSYTGNAHEYFKSFIKKVETTEGFKKMIGVENLEEFPEINIKSASYDLLEEITNPGILEVKVYSKQNGRISFSVYNPLDKIVNIAYITPEAYDDIYSSINFKFLEDKKTLSIAPKTTTYIHVTNIWQTETKIISLIYSTFSDFYVDTVYSDPYFAIATINQNIEAVPYDKNVKSEVDCSKPNNKIECIKTKPKKFVEIFQSLDIILILFYTDYQGFYKLHSPQEKNYVIEKVMENLDFQDISSISNLQYINYVLKFLSDKDCHKENSFQECLKVKKNYFNKIAPFLEPSFDCQAFIKIIKTSADSNSYSKTRSETLRMGLNFYLSTLTNLAKNSEVFNSDTSSKIYSTYKCLKNNIFNLGNYGYYEYEEADLKKLLESIPGYLAEAYQFDLLNGYESEDEIIYQDSGILVSNTTLENKKNIEENIENNLDKKKIIDYENVYTVVNDIEDKEKNYNTKTTIKVFPDSDIKININHKKILEQFTNAYYLETTLYYTYPLASQINSTISDSFVRFNLYTKDKRLIEVKGIKEKPEIYFPKQTNFKGCYYFNEQTNKLVFDSSPKTKTMDGKEYSVCLVDHFTDFTIGDSKDVPPKKQLSDYKNLIITVVLILFVIMVFTCTFICICKRNKRYDEKAIREQINSIEMS